MRKLFASPPLPQQIPEPVELHVEIVEPSALECRHLTTALEEPVLLRDESIDVLGELLVVHAFTVPNRGGALTELSGRGLEPIADRGQCSLQCSHMAKVNIRELKAHLSGFIERVERGETIIVAKRNEPVAELRPIVRRSERRILGRPVKDLHVPATFFEPLPDDVVAVFGGETPT